MRQTHPGFVGPPTSTAPAAAALAATAGDFLPQRARAET